MPYLRSRSTSCWPRRRTSAFRLGAQYLSLQFGLLDLQQLDQPHELDGIGFEGAVGSAAFQRAAARA